MSEQEQSPEDAVNTALARIREQRKVHDCYALEAAEAALTGDHWLLGGEWGKAETFGDDPDDPHRVVIPADHPIWAELADEERRNRTEGEQ